MFVEMKTYRYHGHSMSDPGITYRAREEITEMRKTRDCIELVKQRLVNADWATEAELKSKEKELKAQVDELVAKAKGGNLPPPEMLDQHILHNEMPSEVRMPDRAKTRFY